MAFLIGVPVGLLLTVGAIVVPFLVGFAKVDAAIEKERYARY